MCRLRISSERCWGCRKWIKNRQQNLLQSISDKEKYRIVFWYDNQENPGLADLRKIIH